ncbi:MAG: zinc ribbon domain-containing protein [Herminiimonas sp.]|nr:zinc ribbon domain-containing protein [Herminiimonas sp.]
MPIYAYRCEACGFSKDVLQKISDPQLTVCLSCGQPTFKKQLTAAGFQLKGTGWYVTDFKGGAATNTAPAAAANGVDAPALPAAASTASPTAPASSDATPAATPAAPAAATKSSNS